MTSSFSSTPTATNFTEYYEFEINLHRTLAGICFCRVRITSKDGLAAFDDAWEIPGLETAVHVDGTLNDPSDQDKGWSVEIAIPWKALRAFAHRTTPPLDGDQWRVNFSRVEWQHEVKAGTYQKIADRREDNWVWSPQGIVDMHRPERWGFVQFSTSPAGTVGFVVDPTLQGREVLLEVYHRQKEFHQQHQCWANSLDELGLAQTPLAGLPDLPTLKITASGFRAIVEIPIADNKTQAWCIRQDSRLRRCGPDDELTYMAEAASASAVEALSKYLTVERDDRPFLKDQPFATIPLTGDDALRSEKLLWSDHVANIRQSRAAEMAAKELTDGDLKMPFYCEIFGGKPEDGRSLYISMHGGGGAPKRVNDQQWQNQKKLYRLEEGVYVAPRAPTDTWNLWHEQHIDRMFSRLIEDMMVFENVNPDRVYLMGYSAGGDGVYPTGSTHGRPLCSRQPFAMAGHPNGLTSPLGLRNLPFTIHVGGLDSGYNRNQVARDWEQKLDELHKADPTGYVHLVKVYPDKGHWLDRQDASAIPWMAQYQRNPSPKRVVWKQDDVTHSRCYWLAVPPNSTQDRAEVIAELRGQQIDVQARGVPRLLIRVDDRMLDLDTPVTVAVKGQRLIHKNVHRTIAVLAKTLDEYGDPRSVYSGELSIDVPEGVDERGNP